MGSLDAKPYHAEIFVMNKPDVVQMFGVTEQYRPICYTRTAVTPSDYRLIDGDAGGLSPAGPTQCTRSVRNPYTCRQVSPTFDGYHA